VPPEAEGGKVDNRRMADLPHLEARLTDGSLPPAVRATLRDALQVARADGIRVVDEGTPDYVTLAAAGKPVAVYVESARLSLVLDPERAERIVRAHPSLTLDRDAVATVRCSYAALTALRPEYLTGTWIVEALRRSARNVRPVAGGPQAAPRTAAPRKVRARPVPVEVTLPRCPVPGCNLVMVGGSCGFHD
jgi:hypothetical protein